MRDRFLLAEQGSRWYWVVYSMFAPHGFSSKCSFSNQAGPGPTNDSGGGSCGSISILAATLVSMIVSRRSHKCSSAGEREVGHRDLEAGHLDVPNSPTDYRSQPGHDHSRRAIGITGGVAEAVQFEG